MINSIDVKLFKKIYQMSKKEIESKYTRLDEGAGRIIYAVNEKYRWR